MGLVFPIKSIVGVGNNRTLGELAPGDQYDSSYIAQPGQVLFSAAYTLTLADSNKSIIHPSTDNTARVLTIPSNALVPYPLNTEFWIFNQMNTVTISISTDTLRLAGGALTGNRTLAVNGVCRAVKVAATIWYIFGWGIT